MSIQDEKQEIISLINKTNERWVLKAIKELLTSDTSISYEHKAILDERINLMEEGKAEYLNWDDVKDKI